MKKSQLIDKIKRIVSDITLGNSNHIKSDSKLPMSRFDIINQNIDIFHVLVELMTTSFDKFLKNVYYVAPKPPTFKIILINDQYFFIINYKKSWVVQIEGRKYYIKNIRDTQLASEAISRILKYGKINSDNKIDSISNKPKSKSKEEKPNEPVDEIPSV